MTSDGAARSSPPGSPQLIRVPPNGGIPNHPHLPAVVCAGAFAADAGADAIGVRLRENGWTGLWRWTVFDFHHFHPASHETLAVAAGWARLQLGGPEGLEIRVDAGDAVILPAGFGHRRVASGDGFEVVGAYPPGQENPAIVRADPDAADAARASIAATPPPDRDPVFGADGPLIEAWRGG